MGGTLPGSPLLSAMQRPKILDMDEKALGPDVYYPCFAACYLQMLVPGYI